MILFDLFFVCFVDYLVIVSIPLLVRPILNPSPSLRSKGYAMLIMLCLLMYGSVNLYLLFDLVLFLSLRFRANPPPRPPPRTLRNPEARVPPQPGVQTPLPGTQEQAPPRPPGTPPQGTPQDTPKAPPKTPPEPPRLGLGPALHPPGPLP